MNMAKPTAKSLAKNKYSQLIRAVGVLLPSRPYYSGTSLTNKSLRQIRELIKEETEHLNDLCYTPAQVSFPTGAYIVRVLNIQKRRYATRGSGVNIYPRSGPARGLIKIIREFYSFERLATEKYAPNSGRNLISYEVKRWMPPGKWDGASM